MTASSDLTSPNSQPDKFETHYRLQLSAMMDGELSLDEARFLLRRLGHDEELSGCWERWQLCSDILRGQVQAPAPSGFAQRIALAIAAEPQQPTANRDAASRRPRSSLARWGGGALAASVALVALFMARQQGPQDNTQSGSPAIATQAPTGQTPADTSRNVAADSSGANRNSDSGLAGDAVASAATGALAVASVPRRQDSAARRSATRTQQAGRNAARVSRELSREPQRAVATAASSSAPIIAASPALAPPLNPFSKAPVASQPVASISTPQARPWPRAVLQQPYPSAAGGLTVGLPSDSAQQTFYPFEPSLPAVPPVVPPEPAPQD